MEDKDKFINYINKHYDEMKASMKAFCYNKKYPFDEDIFQDTILKCYLRIEKQGYLKNSTEQGMKDYFFISFKQNLKREQQYSRVQKRDNNIVDLSAARERYLDGLISAEEKLKSDLKKDFSCLYILSKVEQNFDSEHFYLFRLKTFNEQMTYKGLYEKTKIKGCRQKVVQVKQWIKQNITKKEIDAAFDEEYGNLIN